jgi:sterol desaturase/sphingolipid hydroxylase (fatty acid hydroxylase superfamily)
MFNHLFNLFSLHCITYWSTCFYYDSQVVTYKNYVKNELRVSIESSLLNQICGTLPSIYLFLKVYPVIEYNFLQSILCIPCLIMFTDVYFYTIHRLCHSYLWFIHKHHHIGDNYSVKSLDAHIIEHIFINIVSISWGIGALYKLGFIFNIYSLYLWTFLSTIYPCLTHSEVYNENSTHLKHHKFRNCNYGVGGIYLMDRMFGTYI